MEVVEVLKHLTATTALAKLVDVFRTLMKLWPKLSAERESKIESIICQRLNIFKATFTRWLVDPDTIIQSERLSMFLGEGWFGRLP